MPAYLRSAARYLESRGKNPVSDSENILQSVEEVHEEDEDDNDDEEPEREVT